MLICDVVDGMPYLNRYALKLTRNKADADDLVMETILLMLEKINEGNFYIERPKPYMAKVMYYRFVSKYNARKNTVEFEDYMVQSPPDQDYFMAVRAAERNVETKPLTEKKILTAFLKGQSVETIYRKVRGPKTGIANIRATIGRFRDECAS